MPYGTQTSIAPLVINPVSGAVSGFATGAGLTFHGGGTISGASGAVNVTTAGTNTDFVVTPIGSGRAKFQFAASKASFGEFSGASGMHLLQTATSPTSTNFALLADAGNLYVNSSTAGNDLFLQHGNNTRIKIARTSGNVLVGGLTTDGTGVLQFPVHTTTAGGIALGTAAFLHTQVSGGPGINVSGTSTNDAAPAGYYGELLSAQLAAASATSLVTATGKTVISVSLTAGDWEVSGSVHFIPANTTVVASLIASISATDNTQASADSVGGYASIGAVYTSGGATMSATPIPIRVSLAATTTYYLVATGTFSVSTCTAYGTIRARRLR